ncbi:hypothetical protein Q5H91_06310 [Sphingomonas sp. KR1UV-12]|uniref:Outer membrane protein n=1 Tax=Sphingomonas aurea TaxID=3063994 RepID=A0ABT9EIM5_9SPHN|nr:hypothetical protein [Sphingomonas sp. KR1UV-12]MDP1026817.1 hypothetical protein [Sphingomonas sp. KR1UV-12]
MAAWRRLAPLLATIASAAGAQTVPTIDTEDASLGSVAIGSGRFHPTLAIDLRNGDFARGNYDDDAANLDRLPIHAQLGFGFDLHRDAAGQADLWLVGTSSNGFHAPATAERATPRAWYESNNLIGLVGRPTAGLSLGAAYTIKASPNGVSDTTHEASVTAAYERDHGIGALHPSAAVTVRPKGGGGLFTQLGIEPELLEAGNATISLPVIAGVGWHGFYAAGTGDVGYASVGLAYTYPFVMGAAHWRLRIDGAALVRDDTLRRLSTADAETATVVPLVTVSLATAF